MRDSLAYVGAGRFAVGASILAMFLAGCTVGEPLDPDDPYWDEHAHDETRGDVGALDRNASFAQGLTVQEAATSYCTTASVRWLSEQLIEEINCMQPGTMARIDDIAGVELASGAFPFLQAPAAAALERAVSRGGSIGINSSLRTTVQQYVLYTWYRRGLCTHVVSIAAPPGRSNHESGLAIDTSNYSAWRSTLESSGFSWLGSRDPVHFDYAGSGAVDLRRLSVLAFQRLWNRNHPEARISEDGAYGPQTEGALRQAPADGFAVGASCAADPDPAEPALALEVYWARNDDGSYKLHALAPSQVTRVEYYVDGYLIGEASRADGDNFPDNYVFSLETSERLFEVLGYDAADQLIGRGVGLMDVTPDTAVYIKQMGASLYEIGLERAPADVASIEVRADGYVLVDTETGATRSDRNAVRYRFQQLGARQFVITMYDAGGAATGTLYRTFTLE